MSRTKRDWIAIMVKVREGELTFRAAAPVLGLSYRQTRRVWRRFTHRQWRERKPCFGAMVQLDQGAAPPCLLMVMVDDANNRLRARFNEEETARASYDVFEGWVRQHRAP